MKLGISTYSLVGAVRGNRMTFLEIFDWAKEHGAEHVEIVPVGRSLAETPELIQDLPKKSKEVGIPISNYAIGGNLLQPTSAEFEQEVERLKSEVDIAHAIGVTRMRHDIAWRSIPETTVENFERDFPRLVEGCQAIADHAQQYGIVTSIENHGYHVQGSDRVLRIVQAVNRPNFKTTIDTGNFLVVDEDPAVSVPKNLPFASMVHIKDMYYRKGTNPGEGWGPTVGGRFFRGAIFGFGDLDVNSVMRSIAASGYDGYVSIEFEGQEAAELGARLSLQNAQRIAASL